MVEEGGEVKEAHSSSPTHPSPRNPALRAVTEVGWSDESEDIAAGNAPSPTPG